MNDAHSPDLMAMLENVEFCNMETGEYFRGVALTQESTGPVIIIKKTD